MLPYNRLDKNRTWRYKSDLWETGPVQQWLGSAHAYCTAIRSTKPYNPISTFLTNTILQSQSRTSLRMAIRVHLLYWDMNIRLYKSILNSTYLIKQVKPFNLNLLILYWICVGFANHVKNCLLLCRVSSYGYKII